MPRRARALGAVPEPLRAGEPATATKDEEMSRCKRTRRDKREPIHDFNEGQ